MELTHTFTVPVPPRQAFAVLQDIERIGPCMPGATIDSVDGKDFTGTVKVKIGPIKVTYSGAASYAELDADALTAVIDARGKETRGSGTANATVKAALTEVPDGTEVHVVTDLAITGKPAQFGRGVMEEVGQKLINTFAECLAETLGEDTDLGEDAGASDGSDDAPSDEELDLAAAEGSEPVSPAAAPKAPKPRPVREAEAIDLLDVAGTPVAKRLAPVVGGLIVLAILWKLIRR